MARRRLATQSALGPDCIEVRGLRVNGQHGVTEAERAEAQPFEVDLDLYLGLAPAAADDELGHTSDYAVAVAAAVAVVQGAPRRLLETLAVHIAAAVLADDKVDAVTVAVRKLRPPVPFTLGSAGVRVTRRR